MSSVTEPEKIKNEKVNNYINLAELMYICYFAVMLGAKAIGLYEGQFAYNVALLLGAFFFICKVVTTRHNLTEILLMAVLFGVALLSYLQAGEKSLLIYFTMMLGIKGVSLGKVFKTGAAVWITSFVTMYVLSVVGVTPEYSFILNRRGWDMILRHSLGYPHPNTLHASYFVLAVFVLYLARKLSPKYITAISVALLLGNGYVFMYSVSRNGFLGVCIYVLLNLYLVWRKERSKLENVLLQLIMPLGVLFIVFVPLIADGAVYEKLNTVLAGRVVYTKYYLTYEPLRLFGIESIPVPEERYVIDSSYIYLLFRLGIIPFILSLVLLFLTIRDAVKENRKAELAILLGFSIYGVLELLLFNQSYKNLTYLFIGSYLYRLTERMHQKEFALIKGETIRIPFGNKTREKNPIIPINIWFAAAVLMILTGVLTSLLYTAIVPAPKEIYLPQEEYDTWAEGDPFYLSRAEVKSLKKEGAIIRGYIDETTPIYRMRSTSLAKMERIRYTFSYGLWAGSVVVLAFLSLWITRSKVSILLRRHEIRPEYKENVLIVHNYYRIPGGEDIVVANEKALLEEHGHKVTVYSRNNADAGDHGLIQKIGLAFVSIFNFRTYRDICKIIDKEKIDVIHIHNTIALVSPAAYIAGINRGVPVVQTIHNFRLVCPNGVCYVKGHVCERCLEHGLKASLLYNCYRDSKLQTFVSVLSMKIQRILLTYRAVNYICLTEFNKEKLLTLKQIRPENVFVKPNFTKLDVEMVPYEQRKKQFVYAGRLEKIKGMEILLQAWMKLGADAPKLVICGSGESESWCKEYIENNELTSVEMTGQIPNSEVKKLVGESLAMIYPTQWYEGFPMAVAEAYTMGTPIIASDIGNVGNLVEDGVTGLKFKSNSVVALAKAVSKFMESPIRLPEEYLTKYTADENYKSLKSIYETIRRRNE
nr:glycosyltransferase family 4 protein [uncultured Butyrivibrio sp.]